MGMIKNIPRFTLSSIILLIGLVVLIFSPSDTSSQEGSPEVYVIKLDDWVINPVASYYISDSIERAEREKAECLVIELDTPGGLLTSTRKIVKDILNAKIPIVVYVSPSGSRAGSAGVFITLASHIAAMAPATNIGAAHPVEMGEKRSAWDAIREIVQILKGKKDVKSTKEKERPTNTLSEKILNDTVAWAVSIAQQRGRNVEIAEQSVRESISITEDEAVEKGVVNLKADNLRELLGKIDGTTVKTVQGELTLHTKDARIKYLKPKKTYTFLNILANPNIAYILLMLGSYGLIFEFTHPGIGFPGIGGAACMILAFFGLNVLPTNYAGLALILLAIILFIAETQVPSFGILTLGGITSLVLGSIILTNAPQPYLRTSLPIIFSFAIATALITIFLVGSIIRAHSKKVISGKEALIGEKGKAITDITTKKGGKVFVHGELWDVISDEEVQKDESVVVEKIEGMVLKVKKEV